MEKTTQVIFYKIRWKGGTWSITSKVKVKVKVHTLDSASS